MFSICIGCYVFTAFIFQTTPKWILEFFVYTYTGLVQQHITSNKVFNSFHKFWCSPKLRFFDKQELSQRQLFLLLILCLYCKHTNTTPDDTTSLIQKECMLIIEGIKMFSQHPHFSV